MNSVENRKEIAAQMKPAQEQTPAAVTIFSALEDRKNMEAFQRVMGDKAPLFVQTIRNVLLMPQNKRLRECSVNSILRSAMACAVTGLTIDPAFGQAAIVPYGNTATFMPMKNGLVHLANNTGMFNRIHAGPVYEGDIKSHNPFTGDYEFNDEPHAREILVGYIAYIRFHTGGDHYLYMTVEEIQAHAQRYSKTYNRSDSLWKTNFPVMAEKTVIRQILSKWGNLDTMENSRMWLAMKFDQAVPSDMDIEKAMPIYPDGKDSKVEDIESEEITDNNEENE